MLFRFVFIRVENFRQFFNPCSKKKSVDKSFGSSSRFTDTSKNSLVKRVRIASVMFRALNDGICELLIVYVMSEYSKLNSFCIYSHEEFSTWATETRSHFCA